MQSNCLCSGAKCQTSKKFMSTNKNNATRGNCTVQRNELYGCSSIACSKAIEQAVNRDVKTKVVLKLLQKIAHHAVVKF